MVGIDTIVLTLPITEFVIFEPSRFTPNATKILSATPYDMGRNKYFNATCNPSKADSNAKGYLPYLTLYRALRAGGLTTGLRIQLSIPKLLNGNNFDEIEESDFGEVCHRIIAGLEHYKIKIRGGVKTIANAQIVTVHYSKNFVLTNFLSARAAIKDLSRVDVNGWRDVSKTDYVNNGYGFKTHSKYFELAFYDKLAEYGKAKRGQPLFDTDIKQIQLNLFDDKTMQKPFEVLRMEVRFGNTKAIKQALRNARLPTDDISFSTIYRQDYSQMVLEWQLKDMYEHYPKITEAVTDDVLKLFGELYVQNPERNISSLVNAIGLHTLNQHSGMRAIRDVVGSKGSQALLRLAKRANNELNYATEKSEVFELLADQLDRFEPVYISNFDNKNKDNI
jgi:hypothetical protein